MKRALSILSLAVFLLTALCLVAFLYLRARRKDMAIARALVNHSSILLADEPTGNLDSKTERNVMKLLTSLAAAYGTSILLVTHNENLAKGADRILRLEDGEIVHG